MQPEGEHEFVAMELCSNRAMLPQLLKGEPLELEKKHAFTVKQPELPALNRPEVRAVKVEANGKQVAVSWEIHCAHPAASGRKRQVNVVPFPISLVALTVPPCASTRVRTIARPRPEPPPARLRALSTR